jgi:hypothetical protein
MMLSCLVKRATVVDSRRAMRHPAAALLVVASLAAVVAPPAAQAFRRPTSSERKAIKRAWKKAHKKKAKTLFIQEIRVSTKNNRYAAVLYDYKFPPPLKGHSGDTVVEYFKRKKSAQHARRVSASQNPLTSFISLGQNAPTGEEDDINPLYTVSYYTTVDQQITTNINFGCGVTTENKGDYSWNAVIFNVPITDPDLSKLDQTSDGDVFSGTETWKWPCSDGATPKCPRPASGTIDYHGAPGSSVTRADKSFTKGVAAGNLLITVANKPEDTCWTERGGPLVSIQVPLPSHLWGTASSFKDKVWNVDKSNIPPMPDRLGDCRPVDTTANPSCTESLDQFAGRVRARRCKRMGPDKGCVDETSSPMRP